MPFGRRCPPPTDDPSSAGSAGGISIFGPVRAVELELIQKLIDERDLRYQQRFEAQQSAVESAFSAQKDAVSAAFAAQKDAVAAALGAAERAVAKAEASYEKRFESQNEFRGQLADQAARQLPRQEATVEFTNIREKIDALAQRISDLEKFQNRGEGKSSGLHAGYGYLIGALGLLAAIVGLAARFMQ